MKAYGFKVTKCTKFTTLLHPQVNGKRVGTEFVRKGVVGDHQNHLSEEQIRILDDVVKNKGGALGIGHLWDNLKK